MEKQKPKMSDPEEFAIIRQIYFPQRREETDEREWRDRQESKNKNNISKK